MDIEELVEDARHWLDRHRPLRKQTGRDLEPGDPFSTAVFHALGFDEEKALLAEVRSWQQLKAERGYHAIGWPTEVGGLGLDAVNTLPPTDASRPRTRRRARTSSSR